MANPAQPESTKTLPRVMTREEAALYVLSREKQIRALARNNLTKWGRQVAGSEDIFASVMRRLDTVAAQQKLRPHNNGELWNFVKKIALHSAVNKNRTAERWARLVDETGHSLVGAQAHINRCQTDEEATHMLCRIALLLERGKDRELFMLRVKGMSYSVLAELFRTNEDAVRKRWSELCARIRDAVDAGKLNDN